MIYSISFEVVELSLMWLIPEFQECWWDSVFLDMLGANMLGMFMGKLSLGAVQHERSSLVSRQTLYE
jgi:hypothetical protein